jgi:MOSC domain-containing protein
MSGLAGLARIHAARPDALSIGEARLKVVKHITRCAAVNVDPDTAARDLDILAAIMRRLGHNECGIYTRGD